MNHIPCHICGGDGQQERGLQRDPEAIVFEDCRHCAGTGEEPWRAAGSRDTGPKPLWHHGTWPCLGGYGDILELLSEARAKVRAECSATPEQFRMLLGLLDHEVNADAAWARKHARDLRDHYDSLRRRAVMPVSGLALADMRAAAMHCVTASDRSVAAWREVA